MDQLKKVQKEGSDWFTIQIISGKMSLLSLHQEQLNFKMITLREYLRLRDLTNEFFDQVRKDILQKQYIHKTIRRYRALMQGYETELGNFFRISNEYGKIIITGESYKIISSIMKIFLKRSIVAAGLPQAVGLPTEPAYTHNKDKISPVFKKIRRGSGSDQFFRGEAGISA